MRSRLWLLPAAIAVAGCIVAASSAATATDRSVAVRAQTTVWSFVDRPVPGEPAPKPIWQGEPLDRPRGVMLAPEGDVLYVTDPGEPVTDPVGKPARIVAFPVHEGQLGPPHIFFSRPGFLISAKWGFPMTDHGHRQVLVADQGHSPDDYTFTGEGAKVMTIPVRADGTAGTPRVLWAGKPFVCPTGIAAIHETIYVTDPCAGPRRTRPDVPGATFPSSSIFALKLHDKKAPRLLASGAPFTSLIGICILTPGEIIVNDTDSGRLDPTHAGGRPGFAPPAAADRWVLKIRDNNKPALGLPTRTHFLAEGPVTLAVNPGAVKGSTLHVTTTGRSRIVPFDAPARMAAGAGAALASPSHPTKAVSIPGSSLSGGQITLNIASDIQSATVNLKVRDSRANATTTLSIPKSSQQVMPLLDNKHGGARCDARLRFFLHKQDRHLQGAGCGGESGGGGASGGYLRFTTDNAPGHGRVDIYRDNGGRIAVLWAGPPFDRPVSAQLNQSGTRLWVADQGNGTLFSLRFPDVRTFARLFPAGGPPVAVRPEHN